MFRRDTVRNVGIDNFVQRGAQGLNAVAVPLFPGEVARFDREQINLFRPTVQTANSGHVYAILPRSASRTGVNDHPHLAQQIREHSIQFVSFLESRNILTNDELHLAFRSTRKIRSCWCNPISSICPIRGNSISVPYVLNIMSARCEDPSW